MIRITDDITLDDRAVEERFVRAFGSGGQNATKEATAVELRVKLDASSLPSEVRSRLRSLAGRRVTADGVLVIASRAFRSQLDNRDAARARLVSLLQRAAATPAQRRLTRPRRAVREGRLEAKRRHGVVKQCRGYRLGRED